MTVYLVISLPEIPYIHHIYLALANPSHVGLHLTVRAMCSLLSRVLACVWLCSWCVAAFLCRSWARMFMLLCVCVTCVPYLNYTCWRACGSVAGNYALA